MSEQPARCPKCGHALEADPAAGERVVCPNCQASVTPSGSSTPSESRDPLIGRTLGDFAIVELIGRGAMGAVYKARQVSLGRLVALKTLSAELARDKDFIERFYREARSAAALRHTNVVQVHALGEIEGVHYIAMELVEGEGLDAVLRREGPLAPERALRILKEVCAGLAAAHEAGIVHRDVKPSNILLDSKGSVRLSDFGLARRTEGGLEAARPGGVVGTPLYMAPEVARGEPATPQSDLYSLGATFYHVLTGRPPFQAKGASELIHKHVTAEPTPLGDAARHVDPRLACTIDRLLGKNPSDRYPSAQALLEELEALGQLELAAAAPRAEARAMLIDAPTPTVSMAKRLERQAALERHQRRGRASRKRVAVAAIASAAVLVVASLIVWVVVRSGERAPAETAVKPAGSRREVARAAEVRNENARIIFRWARRAAARGEWRDVITHLDRLEREYANTRFHDAHRRAIAELQAKAQRGLRLKAKSLVTRVPALRHPEPRTVEELAAEAGLVKGLVGAFYAGENFERFVAAKPVPRVEFDWGAQSPLPNVPADHFSTRVVGWLYIRQGGHYTFRFWRDDGARLYLDGKKLIDEWEGGRVMGEPQLVWLGRGWHRLWVEHMDIGANAGLGLRWLRAEQEATVAAELLYCERELLERVRRDPTQDPFVGLRPDQPGRLRAVDVAAPADFFRGALRRRPGGRVEFRYDWRDPAQLRDWPRLWGPPVRVVDGEVQLGGRGSGGITHLASFDGDVELAGTWRTREVHGEDSGCAVTICRSGIFKLYRVKLRRTSQEITKDRSATVIGRASAKCPDDESHTFRFVRSRDKLSLWIDGDRRKEITDPDYTRGTVDLGSWNAGVAYRDIRVIGKPDPEWLAVHPGAARQIAAAPLALEGEDVADLGRMVAKPFEPFADDFEDLDWEGWTARAGYWMMRHGALLGRAQGNAWARVGDRRFDDFVLEADVCDTGREVGFCYGLIFRKVGRYELMFSLSTEYKNVSLRAIRSYVPQPKAGVARVTIVNGGKKFEPKPGQRYHMKVECVGTRVRCYLDDELVGEAIDRALLSGQITLYAHRAETRFDNVRIRPAGVEPGEPPDVLARVWEQRARLFDADERLSAEAKLQAWSEFLERWPKALPQRVAKARRRRDHWHKVVAETIGVVTERSTEYEAAFHTGVKEVADGRLRVVYPGDAEWEYRDWSHLVSVAHVSRFGSFVAYDTRRPLTVFCWNFRHGEDVRVSFDACAPRAHGCTIFGLAGEPLGTGLALAVGVEENRGTTLGLPGQEPWFRGDAAPVYEWRRHELEVRKGVLTYRYEDHELFRRKIDVSQFAGRRVILWAKPIHGDWRRAPLFANISIVSSPQEDWVPSHLEGDPPARRYDQPDANGWLGPGGQGRRFTTTVNRYWSSVGRGRTSICCSGPRNSSVDRVNWEGTYRDCVIAGRCQFLGEPPESWRGSVSIVFRSDYTSEYVASLARRGGASLFYIYRPERYVEWSRRTLGHWPDFQMPSGPLYLVAMIQGTRLEVFCNGKLALAYNDLPEAEGQVGMGFKKSAGILYDFKFRPLPSDPMYKRIYGEKKAP